VTAASDQASLVAYRNTAYARLGQLLKELNAPQRQAVWRIVARPLDTPVPCSQSETDKPPSTDSTCPLT
jgi:hypothetical protein